MISERLTALRTQMSKFNIDAYIIPTDDFHQSEYVCEYFRSREYMSGFTGSAGTLIVTQTTADLWTDGRYFLQAADQLKGTGITLRKSGEPDVPTMKEFLSDNLKENSCLGFYGKTMSTYMGEVFEEALAHLNITVNYKHDLVDSIWTNRPAISHKPAFILDEKYSGRSVKDKLCDLRAQMTDSDCFILSSLDDIAWLYNLRGRDILCNPVVLSYSYITATEAFLFIDDASVSDEIKAYLESNSITILPYDDIYEFVSKSTEDKTVLIDKSKTNYYLFKSICASAKVNNCVNPTTNLKGIKTQVEADNLRHCHVKDGVAVTKLIYWLKNESDISRYTELDVAEKLEKLRAEQELFVEPSFDTISGYGSHGAIIHYEPTPETNIHLKPESFLLLDSGGQYLDGTTDITRTIALGELSHEQKVHFTTVLRGMIALADVVFMKGCTGENLDILARGPFWKQHLNYNHGTGHGIGFFLNVHEGPHRINFKLTSASSPVAFEEGMVVSDEPGIYIADNYGIRIENELICQKSHKNEYGEFLKFETLTLVPIDLDAILPEMMSKEELDFLNNYHKQVYDTLSPFLDKNEAAWLASVTKPLC